MRKEDSEPVLGSVESDEEWTRIKSVLKELSEIDAIEIVKCAKELIEKNGQICYKRSLQGVVDYVNRELGNGRKVVMHSDNGEEGMDGYVYTASFTKGTSILNVYHNSDK